MCQSYEEAIKCLNSRRAKPKAYLDPAKIRGSDDMLSWLVLLGYSFEDIRNLQSIHIAGTNGKGSTCAFTASFLSIHGEATGYPKKVGLYTSPHIRNVRERIAINGKPVSKEQFAIRFFEIWDRLPEEATPQLDIPRYLQLLCLLSFHIFITEKVDVAVFETHAGGEYDATNILRYPAVVAVTSIGMDHVRLLGPALRDIAWHKGGIFKAGSLAYSSPQEPAVRDVLCQRASEKGVNLSFVEPDSFSTVKYSVLQPDVQKTNCSLALAVTRAWLSINHPGSRLAEATITQGVKSFSWPGRFHQIFRGDSEWFLDGAHNVSSLPHTVNWFAALANRSLGYNPIRVLLFSQYSDRNSAELLEAITNTLKLHKIQMGYIIFTTYKERKEGQSRIDRNKNYAFEPDVQDKYTAVWKKLDPEAIIICEPSIEEALQRIRGIGFQFQGIQVLVTGSLHLVSGVLELLEPENADACLY